MEGQATKPTLHQCKICGAAAFYVNFGVISCSSCKMFFKRNAELGLDRFHCDLGGDCDVTMYNRRSCSACRLAKCFQNGMQVILIRGSRMRKNKKRNQNSAEIPNKVLVQPTRLTTLNLLQADSSTLNPSQWTLLSNLIHCYDEHSSLSIATNFHATQNALPPKLRYKMDAMNGFIASDMTRVQRMCERNNDYLALSTKDQAILLHQTVKLRAAFGTTFILQQSGLLDDLWFFQSASALFTPEVMCVARVIGGTFDSDMVFLKLMLSVLSFTTAHYTVFNHSPNEYLRDVRRVIAIHDSYVELAWRYLVYKYSYYGAVLKFCNLMRTLFNMHQTIVKATNVEVYRNIIDDVVEQTEEILRLK